MIAEVDARQLFAESSQVIVKSSRRDWARLQFPAAVECRNEVVGFVRRELSELAGELCEQLTLAVDELLRNAIEHGARDPHQSLIDFNFIHTQRMILFHVRDDGPGFSLESITHAAISNPPEEPLKHAEYRREKGLPPGGFGIMLVKHIADELIYSESGNEVVLIKYLDLTNSNVLNTD